MLQFEKFTDHSSRHIGGVWAFILAIVMIIFWIFSRNEIFDKIINVATFLFVFVIQNNQNRFGKAMQLKLNEIIQSHSKARNEMLDVEELSEEQLEELKARFKAAADREREKHAKEQILVDDDIPAK